MDEEIREKYREAGKIAAMARDKAAELCKPGADVEEVAERAEALIREEGAEIAFPVNVSFNEEAAHYTPPQGGDRTVSEGDIIKIDVGAHVEGYIGDTAVTVDLGSHDELVAAAEEALEEALDRAEPGVEFGRIGRVIQETIESYDYKPIRNLGGHGVDKFVQHSGARIPNIATDSRVTLESGNAYAIEPFATDGAGAVQDGGPGNIYKHEGGNVRNRRARKLLKTIRSYNGMPFTPRWFDMSLARKKMAMRALVSAGVVKEYDVLKEQEEGMVSQAEHTIMVKEEEIEITTRRG